MPGVDSMHREKIVKHLKDSAEVKKRVAKDCLKQISEIIETITETFKSGGKVMTCGNGGSAADSQHIATEFVCMLNKDFVRPGLPAIALTTDTSVLTAYANDISFKEIFKRQIEALGKSGDTLIAISTSGSSANITRALKFAKRKKIHTVLLTGNNPQTKALADIVLNVPSNNTQYIQESHLAVEHIICELVEQNLFASKTGKLRYGYK